MEFKANVWTSKFGNVIVRPGGSYLEIDGNTIGFELTSEAKRFARYLTQADFKNMQEVQEFLKAASNLFEYKDGRAKLKGSRAMKWIKHLIS
jgi:hypothetical protein